MMTSWSSMNHRQAVALAKFLHEMRPEWDVPGIEAALGRARELAQAPDLAIAAILVASEVSNRTPVVITMQGEHWRSVRGFTRPQFDTGPVCTTCNKSEFDCRRYARATGDDHPFVPGDAREQLNPLTGELTPVPDAAERVAELRNLRNFAASNAALPE